MNIKQASTLIAMYLSGTGSDREYSIWQVTDFGQPDQRPEHRDPLGRNVQRINSQEDMQSQSRTSSAGKPMRPRRAKTPLAKPT